MWDDRLKEKVEEEEEEEEEKEKKEREQYYVERNLHTVQKITGIRFEKDKQANTRKKEGVEIK